MTKNILIVCISLSGAVCLSLDTASADPLLYQIYNTIYGTALTSDQALEDTYGLACSDTCEACTQDGDCVSGTCDPIDDAVWIETDGFVVATARFAGYTQSFGYYTDLCVGNDQGELFNVTTTGYLTECSPASQNPGASCIEDSDCPNGACVAPYNSVFFAGGGSSTFGFWDKPSGSPQWFSQPLLNVPNVNDHMKTYRAPNFDSLAPEYLIAWEDLDLGDADYNDLVVVLQFQEPLKGLVCCEFDGDCDDLDNCTDDACVESVCENNAVDCSSLNDQCNVGVCDPGTGNCVQDPALQNGDPCNDGDLCTVNDTCDQGMCGGTVKDCSSLEDQCNLGACDPGTGNCIQNPAPYNGDPCDDGNPGTADDTCSNGVCTGNLVAAAVPTLSEWGMIIFMTIILGIGVVFLLRRRMV